MEASCPKCGTERGDEAAACRKCGLSAARMATFAKEQEAAPEEMTKAWDRALEEWDDVTRHDELLRLAGLHDEFAWAAARYRTRPDDVGKRELERVRKAAEVQMMQSAGVRTEKAKSPYRATMLLLVVLLVAVGGLIYSMVARNQGATPTPPSVTPPAN